MDEETAVTENFNNLSLKKEHRKKRHKLLVAELFLDFSKNTTLHGLRYVTEIGLSTVEKIFWLLMFVISVVLCFLLILQVWFKWCDSPVIVTINERMVPVEEVPFPSITICPQMKSKMSQYEYAKQYLKYHPYVRFGYRGPLNDTIERELKMLDDAMLVCNPYYTDEYILTRNRTDESTVHNIEKIAPTVYDTFLIVSDWRESSYFSGKMFNKVLTSEGFCFTFNTVQQKDMFKHESIQHQYKYIHDYSTSSTGYHSSTYSMLYEFWSPENQTVYPRRGRKSGPFPDLFVMLQQNISDNDGVCNSLYNGYKVYLHHPEDMPQASLYYYPVLPGQVTSLALKFSAMTTSESLMKRAPELRQCYSSNDHELRYFKTYTFNNCMLECLSIYTYKKCGCVSFHMPHPNSSEICPAMQKECVDAAHIEALASEEAMASVGDVCNCLPSCNSVEYDADVLKTNFDWQKFTKHLDGYKEEGFNFSRLEVYFKEPRFLSMRRSELFGLTDFLANCGGLLGLFLGFSFLSIIEVFYFCTLRLLCAQKKDLKEEKKKCDKTNKKAAPMALSSAETKNEKLIANLVIQKDVLFESTVKSNQPQPDTFLNDKLSEILNFVSSFDNRLKKLEQSTNKNLDFKKINSKKTMIQ